MAAHPFQWTDPRTWPWIFDVWLAFVLFGFAKPLWRWCLRRRAENWPAAQARIESSEINRGKWFRSSSSAAPSTASFAYTYEVGGTKYSGTYKKRFGTDEEADDFLRDLQGKTLTAQYNPGEPSRSYVLKSSINTVLASRPPSAVPPLETYRYFNPLPIWLIRVTPLFEALAIIGFALSVWVNIGALTSRWTPPGYFWALHAGIFVVFAPAIFVAQKRVGSTNRKDFWKVVLKGAPDWMRYTFYAVFVYSSAIGLPSWIRALQQPSGRRGVHPADFNPWLSASVVWMVFYWTSFAILYAAMEQVRSGGPRCVNGHPAPPGVNFCSRCGQPIVRA
jgi:Protein of unknown function (DUF3592)